MLDLQNVSVIFNKGQSDENSALKDINLHINHGDFIVVIGSNGAGKSTLMNAIAGNVPCESGKIYLNINNTKIDLTGQKEYERARFIGRIFQNPLLGTAGKMTLQDNMVICSKKGNRGLSITLNAKCKKQFQEQLELLDMGLENRLEDNVEQFSGGQRQAVTLLMAVMSHPVLLLLDEHTAALDPSNASLIMDLTKKFAIKQRLTVMMITHNMQHALSYGNRLLMMDNGQIILDIDSVQKATMTMDGIIKRFKQIRKKDLSNDQLLLQ